jgi:hypothetical protein
VGNKLHYGYLYRQFRQNCFAFFEKFGIIFPAQLPKVEKHFSIPPKQTTDTDLFFA